MRRTILAAMLLLGACSRDLELPPQRAPNELHFVDPPTRMVAPREQVVLKVAGGAGGYEFSFPGAISLSGLDATLVTSDTPAGAVGVYRAGASGAAQDNVAVTDSAGAVAIAQLSVGQRLTVSPIFSGVAPGGAVELRAQGGKEPYTFWLFDPASLDTSLDPSALSTLVPLDPSAVQVRAGTGGNVTLSVAVTDATDDPAARAKAAVQVGAPIQLLANIGNAVAPRETVQFVAVGGEPPYGYGFLNPGGTGAPPSGGTISLTGLYTAGSSRGCDQIYAWDANGQASKAWTLCVGAPLELHLVAPEVAPGLAAQLVATGGKSPYRFRFQTNGNRSGGTVDEVTGEYVPGPNQGATDLLEVQDDVGAVAGCVEEARVGAMRIRVGDATALVIPAALRGQEGSGLVARIQDVALLRTGTQFSTALFPTGTAPLVYTGAYSHAAGVPFATDGNADGHDELVFFDGGMSGLTIGTLFPDAQGSLGLGPTGWIGYYGRTAVAQALESAGLFYTNAPSTVGLQSVYVADAVFTSSVAVRGMGGQTLLAAADLDGNGQTDLAGLVDGLTTLSISYHGGVFADAVQLTLPGPATSTGAGTTSSVLTRTRLVAARRDASIFSNDQRADLFATILHDGVPKALRIDGGPRDGKAPFVDPAGPIDVGATNFLQIAPYRASRDGAPILGAWTARDASVKAVLYDRQPVSVATVATFPGTVNAVGFPDADGNDVPDLLAAGLSSYAWLALGDGDGFFGRRTHVRSLGAVAPVNIGNDWLEELVVATESPGLLVMHGSGHQLAYGAETRVPETAVAIATGAFRGNGQQQVVFRSAANRWYLAEIGPDHRIGAAEPMTVAALAGTFPEAHPADLGGDAPGPDLFSTGQRFGGRMLRALIRTGDLAGQELSSPALPGSGCQPAPVGAGTAGLPIDAVAACVGSGGSIVFFRSQLPGGGGTTMTDWALTTTGVESALAATGAMVVGGPDLVLAGHDLATGRAIFVVGPYADRDTRLRYVVEVAQNPYDRAGAWTVRLSNLGLAKSLPCATASLADVDGNGAVDVVCMGSGRVRVLYGAPGGGFTPGAEEVLAAGVPVAAFRTTVDASRDLLVAAGREGVILTTTWDGKLQP